VSGRRRWISARNHSTDVSGDGVAGGVAAEVEDARLAMERDRRVGGIEQHAVPGFGVADAAARGFRIGVSDEEQTVAFVFQDSLAGEDVGDSVFGHHAAGEGVDAAGAERDGAFAFFSAAGDFHVLEKPESGQVAARGFAEAVIDVGHLGAQSADEDRGVFRDESLAFEAVNHGEHLLGFSHGKDRDEHGSLAIQHAGDGLGEGVFLGGAVVSWRTGMFAAGGFHDQGIHGLFGKKGALLQGAVFEVHIAGVHHAFAGGLDRHADRAEDVAGVMEGGAHGALAIQVEGALDAARFEELDDVIEFAVFEERVFGDAVFNAFCLHHIDRVVKHGGGEFRGFRGEEDFRLRLVLEEDRKRADMVKVRVGDDDGID
jgi:hypothetical protein